MLGTAFQAARTKGAKAPKEARVCGGIGEPSGLAGDRSTNLAGKLRLATRMVPILCAHCVPGPGQAPSTHFLDTLNHVWLVQQLLLHITVEEWPVP